MRLAAPAKVIGVLLTWAAFTQPTLGNPSCFSEAIPRRGNNQTADSSALKTWWHSTGEVNTKTPVRNENVRQSHLYSVQVAESSRPTEFYDSFVYESIPRNGNGRICVPGDLNSFCDVDDQISIESDIGVDMAWSQYLSSNDTIVRVAREDGGSIDPSRVTIRPTNLNFPIWSDGEAVLISVPFSANGYRFSFEFQDLLWEYRNGAPGMHSAFVQNKVPGGWNYASSYDDNMPVIGVEPLNALMIFMSPFPSTENVPDINTNTYHVTPGLVTGLDQVTQSTLYFGPGVYWMTGSAHGILSTSITWIYLAPGAYVKGAFEYRSSSLDLRATGFGVVSGEQYVYQANTANGYRNQKSDDTSLKMWRGQSATGMKWTLHGLTMNAPPFNSMDFYGADPNSFTVRASDYKQVGAFFGQTDGLQMYPGSHVHDVFYHVGDDGIKTYYGNISCERVVVWKSSNAPIVQFGWTPRNIDNITVDRVDVIHTRYNTQEIPWPRALVGSAADYEDVSRTDMADISKSVSNFQITNWRCEGVCPALLGINPLQNIDTMKFSNIWIEKLSPITTEVAMSTIRVFTDQTRGNQSVALGNNSPNNIGLIIENFYVGDQHITRDPGDNWNSSSLGRLNIDGQYNGRWVVR